MLIAANSEQIWTADMGGRFSDEIDVVVLGLGVDFGTLGLDDASQNPPPQPRTYPCLNL